MKKYIAVAICSLAVLLWVGFIWSNSAKTGEESGEMSSQVQEVVENVAEKLDVDVPTTERAVRKSAHFMEYMVLGLLLGADLTLICALLSRRTLLSDILRISITLPISFVVALIDEFGIQGATEGRGPSFTDVLIDMSGNLLGVLSIILALLLVSYILKKKAEKKSEVF
ncbi:MAG: VanZ family protein [Clostridia bacterium]|nr:VanZ family protein [Clostridia bacterium]